MSNRIAVVLTFLSITVLIPIIIAGTTSFVGEKAKVDMVDNFGVHSQLWLGGLGVIIHELGHIIAALIFFHHISSFKLLQIKDFGKSDTLGYVNHKWNMDSWYENMGNSAIGLAPFYACSIFLWYVHKYLIGNQLSKPLTFNSSPKGLSFQIFNEAVENVKNSISLDLSNPSHFLIFLIFVVLVSMTGFSISKADWNNFKAGLWYWTLTQFVLSLVCTFIPWINFMIMPYISDICIFCIYLMINSWLYLIFSIILVKSIHSLFVSHRLPDFINFFKPISFMKPKGKHFE